MHACTVHDSLVSYSIHLHNNIASYSNWSVSMYNRAYEGPVISRCTALDPTSSIQFRPSFFWYTLCKDTKLEVSTAQKISILKIFTCNHKVWEMTHCSYSDKEPTAPSYNKPLVCIQTCLMRLIVIEVVDCEFIDMTKYTSFIVSSELVLVRGCPMALLIFLHRFFFVCLPNGCNVDMSH